MDLGQSKSVDVKFLNKLLISITTNIPGELPVNKLQELANYTLNTLNTKRIFDYIWKKLNTHGKYYVSITKALGIVHFLLIQGDDKCLEEIYPNVFKIKTFQNFVYRKKGRDVGIQIRKCARDIIELLRDQDKLFQLRYPDYNKDQMIIHGLHQENPFVEVESSFRVEKEMRLEEEISVQQNKRIINIKPKRPSIKDKFETVYGEDFLMNVPVNIPVSREIKEIEEERPKSPKPQEESKFEGVFHYDKRQFETKLEMEEKERMNSFLTLSNGEANDDLFYDLYFQPKSKKKREENSNSKTHHVKEPQSRNLSKSRGKSQGSLINRGFTFEHGNNNNNNYNYNHRASLENYIDLENPQCTLNNNIYEEEKDNPNPNKVEYFTGREGYEEAWALPVHAQKLTQMEPLVSSLDLDMWRLQDYSTNNLLDKHSHPHSQSAQLLDID